MKNNTTEKIFINDALVKCNRVMLSMAILLFGIGIIAVFSADYSPISLASKSVKQFIWAFAGVILATSFTMLNYKKLNREKILKVLLIIFTVMLAILFACSMLNQNIKIGDTGIGIRKINGAYRWFSLGFFNFQPSVFIKVILILFAAAKLSNIPDMKNKKVIKGNRDKSPLSIKEHAIKHKDILEILVFSLIILVLVLFQPSFMVATSIGVIALAIIAQKNAKFFLGKYFFVIAAILLLISIAVWNWLPHIHGRLGGDNFQSEQAILAISSGGLTGLGIGQGEHKYPGRLPEVENDFIFSIIAQETGFIGSIIFLGIYLTFIATGFWTALNAQDSFGKLAAFGITTNYAFSFLAHMFVNLGFVNTGASLPFVSYGGTAILADAIMLGILLNISSAKYERIRL